MDDDTLTITFDPPLQLGETTYDSLTLVEPTAEQLEKAATVANQVTSNIILISTVSNVPQKVVRMMKMRDLLRAQAFLQGFTPGGQETGEN